MTKRKRRLTKGEKQLAQTAKNLSRLGQLLTAEQYTKIVHAILTTTIAAGADVLISQYGLTPEQCTQWGLATIAKTQRALTSTGNDSTNKATTSGHQ